MKLNADKKVMQLLLDGIPQKRISDYSCGRIISDRVGHLSKQIKKISAKFHLKQTRRIYSVAESEELDMEVLKVLRHNRNAIKSGVLIIGLDASIPFSAEVSVVQKKKEKKEDSDEETDYLT
ncbi:MAG: hypothetical protein N4A71_06640 [Carboxylicivirga sp.]|jgi:hypothetical protein|nr:hypothetical protein [Carboxylicivirga sp.]